MHSAACCFHCFLQMHPPFPASPPPAPAGTAGPEHPSPAAPSPQDARPQDQRANSPKDCGAQRGPPSNWEKPPICPEGLPPRPPLAAPPPHTCRPRPRPPSVPPSPSGSCRAPAGRASGRARTAGGWRRSRRRRAATWAGASPRAGPAPCAGAWWPPPPPPAGTPGRAHPSGARGAATRPLPPPFPPSPTEVRLERRPGAGSCHHARRLLPAGPGRPGCRSGLLHAGSCQCGPATRGPRQARRRPTPRPAPRQGANHRRAWNLASLPLAGGGTPDG